MSAVAVTISGVLFDHASKSGRPVTLIGEAILTDLQVGGGPMPGGRPPQIWGPIGNYPDAGLPIPQPPGPIGIWGGGGVGNYPDAGFPGPQPPTQPPENPDEGKPPPEGGGWGWHPEYGWGYFPMSGGKPQPGAPAR